MGAAPKCVAQRGFFFANQEASMKYLRRAAHITLGIISLVAFIAAAAAFIACAVVLVYSVKAHDLLGE
jgi:hypothetical protein